MRDRVDIGGLGRQFLGQHLIALTFLTSPCPSHNHLSGTQSTKGDLRCAKADFINKHLYNEIQIDVTKWTIGQKNSPQSSIFYICFII